MSVLRWRSRLLRTRRALAGSRGAWRGLRIAADWGGLAAAAAAVWLGFGHWLESTDRFRVARVEVEGVQRVARRDVEEASGGLVGRSTFLLQPKTVCAQVAQLPQVRRCRLERSLPGEVVLRIEERTPAASLLAGNAVFEIDAEGVVLRKLAPGEPALAPLITNVPDLGAVRPGARLEQRSLRAALAVQAALAQTRVGRETTLVELAAFQPDLVVAFFEELPFEVRWGRGAFDAQARRFDVLWAREGARLTCHCREYLDLRFGRDLACR